MFLIWIRFHCCKQKKILLVFFLFSFLLFHLLFVLFCFVLDLVRKRFFISISIECSTTTTTTIAIRTIYIWNSFVCFRCFVFDRFCYFVSFISFVSRFLFEIDWKTQTPKRDVWSFGKKKQSQENSIFVHWEIIVYDRFMMIDWSKIDVERLKRFGSKICCWFCLFLLYFRLVFVFLEIM